MRTRTKPRSSASYASASSVQSSSTLAAGSSSSCASRWVSTGSSATMRMASMARAFSEDELSVIGVHRGHGPHPTALLGRVELAADPGDRDVAEARELIELDEPLL